MPKQLLHEGTPFRLIPMKNGTSPEEPDDGATVPDYPTGKCSPECAGGHPIADVDPTILYEYARGHRMTGEAGDGVIEDYEPSAFLVWSKAREPGRDGDQRDPGDTGYVNLEIEVTEKWLRRQLAYISRWAPDVPKPERHVIQVGPFSWRDLNVTAKTVREARDGSFGKPE